MLYKFLLPLITECDLVMDKKMFRGESDLNVFSQRKACAYDFEFLTIYIQGKHVPIVTYSSKLVVLPSRFIFYSINKNELTIKVARKKLKTMVEFIKYLRTQNTSGYLTPDEIILQCMDDDIVYFMEKKGKSVRPQVEKLLRDFFRWVLEVEGVSIKNSFA